jgi:RNA recognition motif-containing protein
LSFIKLFVGNLPYDAEEQEIRALFSAFRSVAQIKLVRSKTGRSRGFAFVELTDQTEADRAVAEVNGSTLRENAVVVNLAADQRPSAPPHGRGPMRR